MSNVVPFDYQGKSIRFDESGWINATDIAKEFGKQPNDWLAQRDTVKYLCALSKAIGKGDFLREYSVIKELDGSKPASRAKLLRLSKKTGLVVAKAGSGGGTWLHPKLAVVFARWVNIDFAVWCDLHIDALLRGNINAQQRFDASCKALDDRRDKASLEGRGLAKWRWEKQPLEQQVAYWRDQLQIPLALETH